MKKECLARALLVLLILIAIAIPLVGRQILFNPQSHVIELHARMPENGGWSLETIQAEVGQPVRLHITSDDVVHGFAIGKSNQPALEILPGEYVDTLLTFDKPGKYTFYCDRWCGPNHWRMRGTIEVNGTGTPIGIAPQPDYLKLGIDIDSPQAAKITPSKTASAERGAQFSNRLPAYAVDRNTHPSTSPFSLWLRLRAEPELSSLNDADLWDAVAWVWKQRTSTETIVSGQKLYAKNCAACHGETGKGDGVMVRGLPVWNPGSHTSGGINHPPTGEGLASPPDFTDSAQLLGASPALLEGKIIRGGMGSGMPYWGPIFTSQQIEALVSYLYTFAWGPFPVRSN